MKSITISNNILKFKNMVMDYGFKMVYYNLDKKIHGDQLLDYRQQLFKIKLVIIH